ncbi:MAG: glycosyltransferase family 87 protein [Paracoccaceae bacterium]
MTAPVRDERQIWLSAALLAAWATVTAVSFQGRWPPDLSAIYIAGLLWQEGQAELIYAAPPGFFGGPSASWGPIIDALGGPEAVSFPYVYPPLWAVLVAPLTSVIDAQGFADLVMALQAPLMAASVLLAARLFQPARMPLWLWTLIGLAILQFSVQSYVALDLNQPSIAVIFLILLSFERMAAGKPATSGAILALAAAIKLTPAAFALIFLIERQPRALLAFTLSGALLAALSLVLAGPELHLTFLHALSALKGSALLSAVNVSLLPAILSLAAALGFAESFDGRAPTVIFRDVPAGISPAITLAALGFMVLLVVLARRWPREKARGLLLLALSVVIPLFGPLGWAHYYLMPLLLLPGLLMRLPPRAALPLGVAVGFVSAEALVARIGALPWPVANYIWAATAVWLCVLFAIIHLARRGPKPT